MTRRRASIAALAVVAVMLLIGACPGAAEGKYASLRSVKSVAKLERPVHWVGGAHVHENATQDTDVFTGVLSVDGRYGLVVQHQSLPQLAPIKTTFTVRLLRQSRRDRARHRSSSPLSSPPLSLLLDRRPRPPFFHYCILFALAS